MKDWTIKEIETLTEQNVLLGRMRDPTTAEVYSVELVDNMDIKGHDVYIVDFGGYFGLSALVFKNGRHIHYANDYQLHHGYMEKSKLPQYYAERFTRILFTEDELCESIHSYDEYCRKYHYLRNYWIMQFDRMSIFRIGGGERSTEEEKAYPYMCHPCFCWVADLSICKRAQNLLKQIQKAYTAFLDDDESFRSAIRYELENHEACYSYESAPALNAMGLSFNGLSDDRKRIVLDELERQVSRTDI